MQAFVFDTLPMRDLNGFDPDMEAGPYNVCRRNVPKIWRVLQPISSSM